MPSLNQELATLLDTYNIETIVYKLAAICWDEAEHTKDKELSKEYAKLGNKLQHAGDTSSINQINLEKIKAFTKERQMAEARTHFYESLKDASLATMIGDVFDNRQSSK